MIKNRKVVVAVCGLLALVLLFSVGPSSIFASDNQAGTTNAQPGLWQKMFGHRSKLNDAGPTKMFDKLVTDGVITQEQSGQISAFLAKQAEERKADLEKIKDMTAEERKAYFEANKPQERPRLLDSLVTAGIITQEKADEITKTLAAKKCLPVPGGQRAPMMRGKKNSQ